MSSSFATFFLNEVGAHQLVGGKARGLVRLHAAGFRVPNGFVATPQARKQDVLMAYRRLGAGRVAVRSSAAEEDSGACSYAGQFDTFLNVSGGEQVFEAVNACRASVLSPRLAAYREDDPASPLTICVIVQRMVDADYAGVAFATADGATVIEGVTGLADRLVGGQTSPEQLPETVRARVALVAREVVERLGGAQDIEWAIEAERLWLLQARPMTTPIPGALPNRFRLWTAANVQELSPRPLTPLSEHMLLAHISRTVQTSYDFAALPKPDGPSVRIVKGRVYLSYSAMASSMSALPGFRMETLLVMFGDNPALAPFISFLPGPKLGAFLRLPATFVRFVAWMLFADQYIERARKVLRQFEVGMRAKLDSAPTDAELRALLKSAATEDRLPNQAMGVTTALATRFLGMLMEWAAMRGDLSFAEATALTITGDLESLQPERRLWALAEWLRANPGRTDDAPEVQARLADFMEVCGCRCEEEAELAHPRWVEQGQQVLRLARQLASGAQEDACGAVPMRMKAPARQHRVHIRFLAAQARTWQHRRERTRGLLAVAAMSLRVLLLAIGRRLCDRTILQAPEEIFYLLPEEIESLLDGTGPPTATASSVARRHAYHGRMLTWPPPPRLLAELPDGRLSPYEIDPGGDTLHGFGAAPGRASGRARVVHDLDEARALRAGEILVTRTTDIGWTPLFRLAAAIVTEIGAPTSHAAIVARELGVPAVVNIGHVTDRVHNGDEVFVDGWAGLIRRTVAGEKGAAPTWPLTCLAGAFLVLAFSGFLFGVRD